MWSNILLSSTFDSAWIDLKQWNQKKLVFNKYKWHKSIGIQFSRHTCIYTQFSRQTCTYTKFFRQIWDGLTRCWVLTWLRFVWCLRSGSVWRAHWQYRRGTSTACHTTHHPAKKKINCFKMYSYCSYLTLNGRIILLAK